MNAADKNEFQLLIALRLPTNREYWTDGDEDLEPMIEKVSEEWLVRVQRAYPRAEIQIERVASSIGYGGKSYAIGENGENELISAHVDMIREQIYWSLNESANQ